MGFMDSIKEEQKKYGAEPSNMFEFEKNGVYKMRILHQPKVIATHFFGKGNPAIVCVGIDEGCQFHGEGADKPGIKLATYILDRSDSKVKLAELPLSISYALNDLQNDEDYAFDEFPMPYDVKVTYDPDNKDPKAKYRLVASPKREDLQEEEVIALAEALKKQTPEQYVEKRKKKVQGVPVSQRNSDPIDDINPDDIPF
jgi:hypothetical protein